MNDGGTERRGTDVKNLDKRRADAAARGRKYRRKHPGVNTATVRKYRLGWSAADVERQLRRQHYSCAGCLQPIDAKAHLDHDHATGKVRGMLCRHCNMGVGQLKDNPATLRRLIAYLDRDLSKTMVYLIGALKNPRVPIVGNLLRAKGLDVMDEWFTPGPHADEHWQEYERMRGRTYVEALKGRAATNIFLFDRAYLDLSDVVILMMPAGKSAMLELGYAKGRGKRTIVFLDGEEPERFDIMPRFADVVCKTEEELFERTLDC